MRQIMSEHTCEFDLHECSSSDTNRAKNQPTSSGGRSGIVPSITTTW